MNPREMGNRILMLFGRGVLKGVTESSKRQQLQITALEGETIDGVERMQNYGFTSYPTGGDVAVAFVAGNREQGIVLVVDDRRFRVQLEAGEVAIYDDLGNSVKLLRDMLKITAVQHCELEAPTTKIVSDVTIEGSLTVVGNVATTGTFTNNGKNISSTHAHKDVQPGVGNTGVVN